MLENTLLTIAVLLLSLSCGSGETKPNVLLIVIDTLRADHLGCYGYERETSPCIDSLAAAGTRWEYMQVQAPWTMPAMVTIYTGLTEKTHGCGNIDKVTFGIEPELPTIVTILQGEGYNTAGFVNVNYLGPTFGLARGFDYFRYNGEGHGRAGETTDEFINWLDGVHYEEPFFVVFHLFDPHLPYTPPQGYDSTFSETGNANINTWHTNREGNHPFEQVSHLEAMYDGEIRWTDSQLSRLFAALRERNIYDNTLIIFTTDHGEAVLEHGRCGHGHALYQPQIGVPLIISGCGIEAGIIDSTRVGQYDILPTILSYLDIPVPERTEGIDILADSVETDRYIPSGGLYADTQMVSILHLGKKIVWRPIDDNCEMYDLTEDPLEQHES